MGRRAWDTSGDGAAASRDRGPPGPRDGHPAPATCSPASSSPYQCEGAIRPPRAGSFHGLRGLTCAHAVPLIFDEVQSGFGLSGENVFWHQRFHLLDADGLPDGPDLVTGAKRAQVGLRGSALADPALTTTHAAASCAASATSTRCRACPHADRAHERLVELEAKWGHIVSKPRVFGDAFAFDMPDAKSANHLIGQRFYRGYMVYIAGERTLALPPQPRHAARGGGRHLRGHRRLPRGPGRRSRREGPDPPRAHRGVRAARRSRHGPSAWSPRPSSRPEAILADPTSTTADRPCATRAPWARWSACVPRICWASLGGLGGHRPRGPGRFDLERFFPHGRSPPIATPPIASRRASGRSRWSSSTPWRPPSTRCRPRPTSPRAATPWATSAASSRPTGTSASWPRTSRASGMAIGAP
ncbi:MAG: aminotransferase class III-fold pyridoxal phosphate-dependent enzyme [bacterium]